MRKTNKLKWQSPKKWRVNDFNYIKIDGDFAYCKSHNFVYNSKEESRKLHNGLASYDTDARFIDTPFNFYNSAYLYHKRYVGISLKSCVRRVRNCKGIPVGTIVQFNNSGYYPKKKFSLSYLYKVKKENSIDITYEVTVPGYSANFTTCEFAKKLTDALRAEGFLVCVNSRNPNRLKSMLNTALLYSGGTPIDDSDSEYEGESAVAYGYGKRIGFSSKDFPLFGYSNGRENVLWDWFGEFDKWSRCHLIPKTESIEDILFVLKTKLSEK